MLRKLLIATLPLALSLIATHAKSETWKDVDLGIDSIVNCQYYGKWSVDVDSVMQVPKHPGYYEGVVRRLWEGENKCKDDDGRTRSPTMRLLDPASVLSRGSYVVDCEGSRGREYLYEEYAPDGRKLLQRRYEPSDADAAKMLEGTNKLTGGHGLPKAASRICMFVWDMQNGNVKPSDTAPVTAEAKIEGPRRNNPDKKSTSQTKISNDGFSIPLRRRGGVFEVMATLNGELKVFFVVDSGASNVIIPESVARILADNGSLQNADMLGSGRYQFANGDTGTGKVIRLRTLELGGHVLKDVKAVVMNGENVPILLGQSALQKLGKWSINSSAERLDIVP